MLKLLILEGAGSALAYKPSKSRAETDGGLRAGSL
jgi:hypothetical protein